MDLSQSITLVLIVIFIAIVPLWIIVIFRCYRNYKNLTDKDEVLQDDAEYLILRNRAYEEDRCAELDRLSCLGEKHKARVRCNLGEWVCLTEEHVNLISRSRYYIDYDSSLYRDYEKTITTQSN